MERKRIRGIIWPPRVTQSKAKYGLRIKCKFDYQSKCHCSKTEGYSDEVKEAFDYQSKCHCSKTYFWNSVTLSWFDYQSKCHCSKTFVCSQCLRPVWLSVKMPLLQNKIMQIQSINMSLIISQNATAPKQFASRINVLIGLIISQNATAPKLMVQNPSLRKGCAIWLICFTN